VVVTGGLVVVVTGVWGRVVVVTGVGGRVVVVVVGGRVVEVGGTVVVVAGGRVVGVSAVVDGTMVKAINMAKTAVEASTTNSRLRKLIS
jgi:hypothetical protein